MLPQGSPLSKPILLLDEATSSLDPETEAVMQDVIQEEFTDKGHTVCAIAHKISVPVGGSGKSADAVVWMKDGQVEKIDAKKSRMLWEIAEGV